MNLLDVIVVPLKARIPVTPNMFAVLVIGGIVTLILSKLPERFVWISRVAGMATLLVLAGVGVSDLKGGAFSRGTTGAQTSAECVGWDDYVDVYGRVHTVQEGVLVAWNEGEPTKKEIDSLLHRISVATDDIGSATPPPAAIKLHKQVISILGETEKQLNSYAEGGDFNPTRLNRLQDGLGGLVDDANAACT